MKNSRLKERLRADRPMTTISIRMPSDVIDDLKQVAPRLGFSGYQPLIRAYVGQALRADLERLEKVSWLEELVESLRRLGVEESVIREAIEQSKTRSVASGRLAHGPR